MHFSAEIIRQMAQPYDFDQFSTPWCSEQKEICNFWQCWASGQSTWQWTLFSSELFLGTITQFRSVFDLSVSCNLW